MDRGTRAILSLRIGRDRSLRTWDPFTRAVTTWSSSICICPTAAACSWCATPPTRDCSPRARRSIRVERRRSEGGWTLESSKLQVPSSKSDGDAEQLLHRLECAGQLLAVACKAEADVPFAVCAEVDAGHASDAPVLDQILDHAPRERLRRARTVLPARIDFQERIERAGRRRT